MHEQFKLDEAEYFLCRMTRLQDKLTKFIYNLDAFLTAARSVMQFACEEAKHTQEGRRWYNSLFDQHQTLRFFRDQRDMTIHEKPLSPKSHTSVAIRQHLDLRTIVPRASPRLVVRDKDGNVIQELDSSEDERPVETSGEVEKPQESETAIQYAYTFGEWEGPEDVITLCRKHLDELGRVVEDGVDSRILTVDA